MSINKGEFVVILGPSGAGKSTLLNLIGGMDTPTDGSIKIDGEEISKYTESQLSEYRAENIGFIFKFYNILPTLTVFDNVELVKDIVKSKVNKDVNGLNSIRELLKNETLGGYIVDDFMYEKTLSTFPVTIIFFLFLTNFFNLSVGFLPTIYNVTSGHFFATLSNTS